MTSRCVSAGTRGQVWRRRLARDGLRRPAARDAKGPRRGANPARAAPSSAFAPDPRPRAGLRRLARLPEVRDACEERVEGPDERSKGTPRGAVATPRGVVGSHGTPLESEGPVKFANLVRPT